MRIALTRGLVKHTRAPIPGFPSTSPIDRGLVAEYRMNCNTGSGLIDHSCCGNHGALQSGVTWEYGDYGPMLDFDYSHVNLGNANSLDLAAPFTLEVLAYIDSFPALATIYERGAGSDVGIDWYLNSSQQVKIWDGDGLTLETLSSGAQWYNGVVVIHGGTVDYYSMGEVVSIGNTWSYAQAGSATAYLGEFQEVGECFDGKIAGFRVYNRALSAAEIWQRHLLIMQENRPAIWPIAIGLAPATGVFRVFNKGIHNIIFGN